MSPPLFETGDAVEAKYSNGEWYQAVVLSSSDGYTVRFVDDGFELVGLPSSDIRSNKPVAPIKPVAKQAQKKPPAPAPAPRAESPPIHAAPRAESPPIRPSTQTCAPCAPAGLSEFAEEASQEPMEECPECGTMIVICYVDA